jgi:hypothetical protein
MPREEVLQLSEEFRAWLVLAKQCAAALQAMEEDAVEDLWNSMELLERRIFAQPVRGIADARVVAEIGMVALSWTIKQSANPNNNDPFLLGADGELESEYRDTRSAAHLIQAAAKLILGGANG